ncbi:MAG: metallophosphatase family protein [Acidobacteria bacterium]|nr:metallophosphatase family protein [Acidobacteriota bacterium]
MKIGVISDTHGYVDPQLVKVLAGVDAILHAGDVGTEAVLNDLECLARVYAVRGNVDPAEISLPPSLAVQFQNLRVELQHQLSIPQQELENWADGALLQRLNPERCAQFLKSFDPATEVVVFGHSHCPCLFTIGHRLFFNPGSSGARRFRLPRCCGILELFPRGVRGSIIGLEGQNENLPKSIWLPLGEYGLCPS